MSNNQEEPVRPPRSLRDRANINISNSDLPPTTYINTEQND